MYENGNREPDFETLEAIADYFNVDMNYLLANQFIQNITSQSNELNKYLEELHKRPEMMKGENIYGSRILF